VGIPPGAHASVLDWLLDPSNRHRAVAVVSVAGRGAIHLDTCDAVRGRLAATLLAATVLADSLPGVRDGVSRLADSYAVISLTPGERVSPGALGLAETRC
jgi:hypothetical protein